MFIWDPWKILSFKYIYHLWVKWDISLQPIFVRKDTSEKPTKFKAYIIQNI